MARLRWDLVWDATILLIATLNVLLILFDMTYFALRPRYIRYAPAIAAWYDRYKGVEPHWTTDRYRQLGDSLSTLWRSYPARLDTQTLRSLGDTLFRLSVQILSERPYERFGLMGYQEGLKHAVKNYILLTEGVKVPATEAFRRFWALTPANLPGRLALYEKEIRWRLQVCYYRHYAIDGGFVDEFWKLDLPFLVFFWLEFWAGWWAALRTRQYRHAWMYPLVHWYDVLALAPFEALRFFRLLRIWKLYVRLNRSQLINFSNTVLGQLLTQQSRTIAKAISNEVAYQILEQVKRQVASGENLAQLRTLLKASSTLTGELIGTEAAPVLRMLRQQPALYHLLETSLRQALEKELPTLPGLPKERLQAWIQQTVRRTVERLLLHTEAYLASPEGQAALTELTQAILDHLIRRLEEAEMQARLNAYLLEILSAVQRGFRAWPEPALTPGPLPAEGPEKSQAAESPKSPLQSYKA
ncbi:MAG: hypothetical protein KatS3mg026_1877 [Bacteroidia bacterium]|nr:MAG: hypothetical protein KatS3mg026_1877 [Bacteroidia bacterium]